MTLLSAAQAVADEIGINRPSMLVGSADLTARRVLACAQAEGEALYRAHNWSILQREHTFSTVADTANYAVPDDFGRLVQSSAWNRSEYREMPSGITPSEWQFAKGAIVATPVSYFQIRLLSGPLAGSILVDPTPASVLSLVYEYISNAWCESSGGDAQSVWTADSDLCRLDAELLRLGLLWRMKRTLGLEYADDRADYERELRSAIQADLALRPINLAPRPYSRLPNVPDGNFTL